MHQRIDDFVGIAEKHANDNNRTGAMHETMFAYFKDALDTHGFTGDEERLHAILDMDVALNTMGIEVWLDKRS